MRKIAFRDICFFSGDYSEISANLLNEMQSEDRKKIIAHINLRNYYYLMRDGRFRNLMSEKSDMYFEGIGMKIGFFLKGKGLIHDTNGTDLYPVLMETMSREKRSLFLLGSDEVTSSETASRISLNYPGVVVKGVSDGYFDYNDETFIVKEINAQKPDMLIIGMGFPLQEKFALSHLDELKVRLIWCTGGLFDFVSGKKKRAPVYVRALRLEWLYRFLKEPRRMLHRNTVAAFWSLLDIIFRKS